MVEGCPSVRESRASISAARVSDATLRVMGDKAEGASKVSLPHLPDVKTRTVEASRTHYFSGWPSAQHCCLSAKEACVASRKSSNTSSAPPELAACDSHGGHDVTERKRLKTSKHPVLTKDVAPGFLQKVLGHILGKSLSLHFSSVASPVGARQAEPSAPARQSHVARFVADLISLFRVPPPHGHCCRILSSKEAAYSQPTYSSHGCNTASEASTCNLSASSSAENCLAHCSQVAGL